MLGLEVRCLHLDESLGIANAANQGVLNSSSDLIHIHDDDDSIHDDFYFEVVNKFGEISAKFVAVLVDTQTIIECVSGDSIKKIRTYASHKAIDGIHLADLYQKNRFPPISLVYRRPGFEAVSGYDSELPILEDWDFNIRLMQIGDFSFIARCLSNYHIRVGSDGMQAQTITASDGRHDLYSAVVRNKFVRQVGDIRMAAALGVLIGRQSQKIHSDLNDLLDHEKSAWTLKRFIKALINRW